MIATLTNPREKIWGVLLALRPEGITLRGIRLESFDDFLRQTQHRAEAQVAMLTVFYPMHRVERLDRDEAGAGIASLADRFLERMGLPIQEYLSTKKGIEG